MEKTVSAIKARQNLGEIMNEVSLRGDDYVIERSGKPMVAIISMSKYEVLKNNRNKLKKSVGRFHDLMADSDPEEMEALVMEAVQETRKLEGGNKKK
ncbi:MAG: type II toxin-antitoxin system Phd/YefM family antitoxin [Desulfamplus sp.]|nr:type II toxin-antitoxin system Phd/YefM family antitoxin [Desulfamplus sp.]